MFKEEILRDETKLQIAAGQNNTDEVRRLLSSGMVDINCRDHYLSTPLHKAAINGKASAAKPAEGKATGEAATVRKESFGSGRSCKH